MADDFSQSLTPPVSPFAVESQFDPAVTRPPCFSCVFDSSRDDCDALSPDGYIATGALKRLLLRLDPAPADYDADTVDIFGSPWVTETALVESPRLLFSLFRQYFLRLETLVKSSSHDFGQASNLHFQAEHLRRESINFLQYVKVFVSRFLASPSDREEAVLHPYVALETELPSLLLEELFGVALLVGRVRDLPTPVQSCLSMETQGKLLPPSWHLLHLHLDVQWSLLEILHLLQQSMQGQVVYATQFVNLTGENLTNISLFDEQLGNLLCDLIGLAMNRYNKVRPTEAVTSRPYHCTCTKELWTLLIHLLEYRSRVLHTQSFWGYVNALLQALLKGAPESGWREGLPTQSKDLLGFTWWLVTHLAEMAQFVYNGTHQNQKLTDNWSFINKLLKSTCSPQAQLQEEQVRMHLHCCLSLSLLWESNISALTVLWDYYSKNLNGSFSVPWLGVSSLGCVSRTPLSLLELSGRCCSRAHLKSTEHGQLYRSATSFHIFLRILALHLSQDSGDGAPWRQIKGRVYSKFHQRRMQELSEAGLMNFLLLFLVLARWAEPEDAIGRACELLGLLSPGALSISKRIQVWRGQFAFLLLFLERGLDVAALADGLGVAFTRVAKEFYLKTTEPSRKLALWTLLGSYVDGVREVFETSSDFHLSQERLLNQGFGLLLPACRQSELSSALGLLLTVLAQLRRAHQHCAQPSQSVSGPASVPLPNVVKERHLLVAGALWANFFPYLRSLRLSLTPSPQLADSAAGFSLLASDLPGSAPPDLQPNPVHALMQCFAWDENLHPLVVTRYLAHLLDSSALVSCLSGSSGSTQVLTIRAWVRCVLQQHVHRSADGSNSRADCELSLQLSELTRLIFKLPEAESILQRAGLQPGVKQDPVPALATFIKAVGQVYSGLQTVSERSSMVIKALEYVGDVLKHVKPYLANKGPAEGLQLAYWAVGYLVKQWSPLLATSKAQQLLFRIIDVLLLPHALFQQDGGLPAPLLSAVRENLPLYLQGLSVAAGVTQTQGEYLKKQIRCVTSQYLDRFLPAAPSSAAVANHPVLLAACETPHGQKGAVLRRIVLQVLSENFLQFKGSAPPARLLSVLSFMLELLRRTRESDPNLLVLPLPALLRCLLLVNEPQVRKLSTDALQLLLERSAASAREGPCDQVSAALKAFVEENQGPYDQQVYSVLETVSVLDHLAVVGLIPVLSLSLRNMERRRGLGKNMSLRGAYGKLLSQLGESGQAEMVSLEED